MVATLFVIATLFAPARSSLQRLVDTRFHPASAAAVAAAASPAARALRELAQLHEDGIVTDVEFDRKRGELLARL